MVGTETQELLVFHAVVKHASYAKAARELGLTPSGISRVITRMEERLGVRLIQRTTRRLSLTEGGSLFHARTLQVIADLSEAEAELQQTVVRPKGKLRVTAPVVFGQVHLNPLIGKLVSRHPELSVEMHLMDRFVDLVEEGMDLAIRAGTLPDSRLIARKLCTNRRIVVASPDYLKQHGTPQHPDQLTDHECLLFTGFLRPREWRLHGPSGPLTVSVNGRVASNNIDLLATAAKQGVGMTFGATLLVAPALLSGELVRVLPEYEFEATSIYAVFPSVRQLSSKVRAMVDFLCDELCDPPPWDQSLVGKVPGF